MLNSGCLGIFGRTGVVQKKFSLQPPPNAGLVLNNHESALKYLLRGTVPAEMRGQ